MERMSLRSCADGTTAYGNTAKPANLSKWRSRPGWWCNSAEQAASERAGMAFPIHPHMLRHACGYALANAGHDTRAIQAWMGHKNIRHTARYTELAPDRFKGFWRD